MPRWDVHLGIGLMSAVLIISAAAYALLGSRGSGHTMEAIILLGPPLVFGSAALIVGSVLPDIDGKGRVRWVIGPVMGAMILAPPLTAHLISEGPLSAIGYIREYGALLFLAATAIAYLFLLIPMRHRGLMHSGYTGIIFGSTWGIYTGIMVLFSIPASLLAGGMGVLGFGWHLALDGRLL